MKHNTRITKIKGVDVTTCRRCLHSWPSADDHAHAIEQCPGSPVRQARRAARRRR